jgi:hypothetical protein
MYAHTHADTGTHTTRAHVRTHSLTRAYSRTYARTHVHILARTLAQGMSQLVAHPVIVENRGGAAGTVGAAVVANATWCARVAAATQGQHLWPCQSAKALRISQTL